MFVSRNKHELHDPKKLRPEKKGQSSGRLCFSNHRKKSLKYKTRLSVTVYLFLLLGFFILQKQLDPNFLLLCIFFLLCMDLQPYSHNCFSKNIENFVWFQKQYLLGFFIFEKQLANIPDRGFLFLSNTLLLYSLSPYSQTESRTESQIHLLCVGYRNFFSSCAVVSVFCSGGK